MDIAERIRLIRKSKNLTQEQAAEKAGLKRANYARMESRGNSLSLEQLQQIADGLGVAVAEIMGDETSKFSAKSLPGVAEGEEFERLQARIQELEDDKKAYSQLAKYLQNVVSVLVAFSIPDLKSVTAQLKDGKQIDDNRGEYIAFIVTNEALFEPYLKKLLTPDEIELLKKYFD